ncbi:MAG TPA: ERCC4 domain-containing protein [Nitrososphaeraceae archaeon]
MPTRVVVDERERKSRIPDLLRQAGATIDFAQLKVADYIVSPETAIERKTIRDLINSIYDGRLFVQCSQLIEHYTKPVVIIEGNIIDLMSSQEEDSEKVVDIDHCDNTKILIETSPLIYDALAKVALDFRIPIMHTPSVEYTSQLLVVMVNKSLQSGRASGPLLKRIKKGNPAYIQQLSILSSLPGVGDKLALRMLNKFQTPKRALNASIAELARISGFGTERAARVRKILDYETNTINSDTNNERFQQNQRTLLGDLNDNFNLSQSVDFTSKDNDTSTNTNEKKSK